MKKILLGISVFFATLISAQYYPDYYPTNSGNSGYYGNDEDEYYFPDDYYYDYPSDYYTDNLYESYYNDYRRSIYDVNWNRFFARYRLSPWQVQQIIMLNESFPSFSAWNTYYRHNPDRWYYDRFYALERIMGPRIFVVFQNNYYRGYNPVVYFQNYIRQHYVTNIYVVPRYRNININRYRIDRNVYHQNTPRSKFGFNDSPRIGSSGNSSGNGFRNDVTSPQSPGNGGFRTGSTAVPPKTPNNNGLRTYDNARSPQNLTPRTENGSRNDSGFRSRTPDRNTQDRTFKQNTLPGSRTPSASKSKSGLRFTAR